MDSENLYASLMRDLVILEQDIRFGNAHSAWLTNRQDARFVRGASAQDTLVHLGVVFG